MNRVRPCWAPIGIRPGVAAQFIREYIYLYGAVSPKEGTCVYLIMPTSNSECSRSSFRSSRASLRGRTSCWSSMVRPTTAAATLLFPTTSRCCTFRRIRRNSIRRKISGMKFAKRSPRTTRLSPWTRSAPSSGRRSSTSSAIPCWSAPSPRSPISSSHCDVELVLVGRPQSGRRQLKEVPVRVAEINAMSAA